MPSKIKKFLEEIAKGKAPGPSPTFSIFQMLQAIELIGEKEIGRGKLAERLNVGDGAVRTIISRLKKAGLITTSKAGCSLTSKGSRFWNDYKLIFKSGVSLGKIGLTQSDYNYALLIKNYGSRVSSGMEQRDAAIKMGANAAVTIVFRKEHLMIPSVTDDLNESFPKLSSQIIQLLCPEENDVIVITGAASPNVAHYAALAAAWTLLD